MNNLSRVAVLAFFLRVLPLFSQTLSGEVTELRKSIVKIDTADWSRSLKAAPPVYTKMKSWRVIGLGEQTHGTHEFYRNKEHLIRFVVNEFGFRSIGLEAPMAEVALLNEYVQTGRGEVKKILKAFRQFTFETQEFVSLTEWVKDYNSRNQDKVQFFGFDFQSPFASLDFLGQQGTNPQVKQLADSLRGGFFQLSDALYSHQIDPESFREIATLSDQLISLVGQSGRQDKNLNRYTESYRQFLLLNNPVHKYDMATLSQIRDSLMAVNVLSYLETHPGHKAVLWGHNGHVQKTANVFSASMGEYLHKSLRTNYGAIGQTTASGYYTAYSQQAGKVTDQNPIHPPAPSQMEHYFQAVGVPVFILDVSRIKSQKLKEVNSYKLLVYGATDKQVMPGRVTSDFDLVIHTDTTTGAKSFYLP
jgi:erythromycin esterase-like protein